MSKHERRLGAELERLGAREEALVKEVQRLATHEAKLAATVEQLKGTSHPVLSTCAWQVDAKSTA